MQKIVIVWNPRELANPDLDLRYCISVRIAELTRGAIQDNGYDYIDADDGAEPLMGIWLEAENESEDVENCTLGYPA